MPDSLPTQSSTSAPEPSKPKKLIFQDWLFILAVIFNVGASISTYWLINFVNITTGSNIGKGLESNPLSSALLAVPALQLAVVGCFWLLAILYYRSWKKRFLSNKVKAIDFNFLVISVVVLLFFDFINDAILVLKLVGL